MGAVHVYSGNPRTGWEHVQKMDGREGSRIGEVIEVMPPHHILLGAPKDNDVIVFRRDMNATNQWIEELRLGKAFGLEGQTDAMFGAEIEYDLSDPTDPTGTAYIAIGASGIDTVFVATLASPSKFDTMTLNKLSMDNERVREVVSEMLPGEFDP